MYKKALVPVDGSELAECVLPHVISLVKDGAIEEVTLLNVMVSNFDWHQVEEDFNYSGFKTSLLKKSQDYLTGLQSKLNAEGINIRTISVEGSFPAETITDYARANGVDMIIMSTHGRTGKKILMFGSTALSVLHESAVPVLLIRPASYIK